MGRRKELAEDTVDRRVLVVRCVLLRLLESNEVLSVILLLPMVGVSVMEVVIWKLLFLLLPPKGRCLVGVFRGRSGVHRNIRYWMAAVSQGVVWHNSFKDGMG